jgi:hypothetical protein
MQMAHLDDEPQEELARDEPRPTARDPHRFNRRIDCAERDGGDRKPVNGRGRGRPDRSHELNESTVEGR